jgi:hypothetical protein
LYQIFKSKRAAAQAIASPVQHEAVSEPSTPESAWDELGGNVDNAELNRWIEELWMKSSVSHQPSSHSASPPDLSAPATVPVATDEVALVTLHKRYKFALTMLYVSATVAFCVGLLSGIIIRGSHVPSVHPVHIAENGIAANEVVGTIFYINENGERRADVDAVIIGLPMDRVPSPLFSSEGLRPGDELNHGTVQLIRELGGMHGRADVHGAFTLPYREGVRYLVIKISAHQTQPGVLPQSVLQELRRYFRDPERFDGNSLWTDEFVWSGGRYTLRHTFE